LSKSKKLVYVSENLCEEAKKASRELGYSLTKFVESSVALGLSAAKLGYTPERASEVLNVLRAQKALGGAFIPQGILSLITEGPEELRKELLKASYESGLAHGRYLREKSQDPLQSLKTFLEVTRWDLNEVEVERERRAVKLRCVSTSHTARTTELLAKFVEGLINGLGFQVQRIDWMRGIIVAEFEAGL
jgi:hypothetical protein